jgi:hypothetical protein
MITGRNSMAEKNAQEIIIDPPKNVLYVVLHGLICLIDDNRDTFIADLIDMGDDHKYLCGDFLFEDPIQSGLTLKLDGVNKPEPISSDNQLDPMLNAVVKLQHEPDLDNYYQSRITLPRPAKIHYYIKVDLTPGSLPDAKNELVKPPATISGIRVFEYFFVDYKGIHVVTESGEMFWDCPEPVTVTDKATGKSVNAAVLHIYNEPADILLYAGKHNKDEFNFTLAYLGAQLRLSTPAMTLVPNPDPPLGIIPEELHSLDLRQEMIPKLSKTLRQLGHAVELANFKLDFAPDKLKQDADVFGGGGGTQVCGGANGLIGG